MGRCPGGGSEPGPEAGIRENDKTDKEAGALAHRPLRSKKENHREVGPLIEWEMGALRQSEGGQAPHVPLVDRPELMDLTEVGRTDQGRRLGEFQRPAVPQEAGHELGAEVVVTPVQREVEEAGEGTQQIVVVSLPLGVHSTDLPAEAGVYLWGDGQLIEAAGDLLPLGPELRTDLFLHQPGREGKVGVFPGKAVKGTYGAVQSNGCMDTGWILRGNKEKIKIF